MKKYLQVILVVVFILGLTACGKSKKTNKYNKIYCEKNTSSNIKESIETDIKEPKEIKFIKETFYTDMNIYKKHCSELENETSQTAYTGVSNSLKCDEEKMIINETKTYIVADAKNSFDLDYIDASGNLDDKKFIDEFEIDGYKCEYK